MIGFFRKEAQTSRERRRHERARGVVVADLRAPDSVRSLGRGCIVDLSAGGIAFESQADFKAGSDIELAFSVPIEVRGRIVRAKKEGALTCYAVRLERLGEIEKRHLERWVGARLGKK